MGVNSNGTVMMDQGVFENLGSVTWDTTAKTVGFTAVSGNGYFVNTTSGAITVTLPSSPSAGDVVGIKDYANTADTNAITIGRNGSNIDGVANNFTITTEGLSALLVYVDATKGWLITNSSQASDIIGPEYIVATGGTITCCGDYKIHTFTSPGTFTVSSVGNPVGGPNNVDYLVVAGGGGAGNGFGGGGGAGGYRTSFPSPAGVIPVSATGYPITVGAGGAGGPGSNGLGTDGTNSIFSTITSTGGGGGGFSSNSGRSGGSGGGSGGTGGSGGAGNTPPVSPSQGFAGGTGGSSSAGGGGGASEAGNTDGTSAGGDGLSNSITGSPVSRGGGGSGRKSCGAAGIAGDGGGGGGNTSGTINTGGGGGADLIGETSGAGGSGIVIIRYKYQ
jgi:hypothetical protein